MVFSLKMVYSDSLAAFQKRQNKDLPTGARG